jgi:hypothetical protein
MAVSIFSEEYWRMVAEQAKQAAAQQAARPEPSPEEVKRALLDEADRWSPEARHWLGI